MSKIKPRYSIIRIAVFVCLGAAETQYMAGHFKRPWEVARQAKRRTEAWSKEKGDDMANVLRAIGHQRP